MKIINKCNTEEADERMIQPGMQPHVQEKEDELDNNQFYRRQESIWKLKKWKKGKSENRF